MVQAGERPRGPSLLSACFQHLQRNLFDRNVLEVAR